MNQLSNYISRIVAFINDLWVYGQQELAVPKYKRYENYFNCLKGHMTTICWMLTTYK